MLQIICFILIVTGGVIMTYATTKYRSLIRTDLDNMPPYAKLLKNISFGVMVFFIFGYIVGAVDVLVGVDSPMFYFIGIVFFLASFFILLIMQYLTLMTQSLMDKNEQIATHNKNLESEVHSRMAEVMHHDRLLRTVNDVSSILLASDVATFGEALWTCMGMLGRSVSVDRVYIWQNHMRDGRLHCTQVEEWSEGAQPQQGNELTVDIPYDENIPGWEEKLSSGGSVKGLVRDLSEAEQRQLAPQGIISILVVPVFLQDHFWGFVGFDDCHAEREFSEAEENILRSGSLLIATGLLRNEMTQSLVRAREDALASTQAKGRFLSNMSHEIRTPINAITGMATIARKSGDMDKVRDCLDKIDAATRQLLAIINDILDMSKIEAGKMELASDPFDPHEMLANVQSIIGVRAAEKRQHFAVRVDEALPHGLVGDDVRLSQILINLLSNAVKFTPEEGHIELDVRVARIDGASCHIEASVTDDGIGISREQQGRLFQAFEQAQSSTARQFGGTGLGLAISRHIAELMDGGISLQSELGEGSRFTARVTLRLDDGAGMAAAREARREAIVDLSGHTALLVEDIQINREIVEDLLADRGMRVDCAENGQEAVDMFRERPLAYDIIFMDVHMPVMDGYTATRTIRALDIERAKTVPIIAMTANAFSEDVKRCLDAGMDGHIAKPVDVQRMYQVIAAHLK